MDMVSNQLHNGNGAAPTISLGIKEQLPPGEAQAKAIALLMQMLGHRRKPIRGTG